MESAKWPKLETELRRIDPKKLRRRDVNARFMEPAQFERLVENVKLDGKLTSAVLACQNEDGSLEILSGHHRTEAAAVAGIREIDVMVITTPLDDERRTAIQLSHNAIAGEDNPALLAQLYESLDLDGRRFSGLTDSVLKAIGDLSTASLTTMSTTYEELVLSFLPEEKDHLELHIRKLQDHAKKHTTLAARLADFDDVFNAIVRVKHSLDVINSAAALALMAELACERLNQIEAEDAPAGAEQAAAAE